MACPAPKPSGTLPLLSAMSGGVHPAHQGYRKRRVIPNTAAMPADIAGALSILIRTKTRYTVIPYGPGLMEHDCYLNGKPAEPEILHLNLPGKEHWPARFDLTLEGTVVRIQAGPAPSKEAPNAFFDLNDPKSLDEIVVFLNRYDQRRMSEWWVALYALAAVIVGAIIGLLWPK